ncbi:BON domain-containing protein [Legionella dresdenensis]|uniref:BON domain-containing protein n=1 Tax=Legionella dresdenensis TaxID=450200 RepID=A0ABV8CCJ5_9GAMM
MFKKTLLCGALAFTVIAPEVGLAAQVKHTNSTAQSAAKDTAITAKVKALFAKSSLIKGRDISVVTVNRKVILSGTVDTDLQYERAIVLAGSVDDVRDVDADTLIVKSSESPMADTYITAKVKGRLLKEKIFGDKDIEYWPVSVETKNGIVYLAGSVETAKQRSNIVNLVKGVKGVKSVKSSLSVKD